MKLTTSSSTLNYDKARARFANMGLGETTKNSLKNSSYKFGFSDLNTGNTTHSSAFKPIERVAKNFSDNNNKKTNIGFSNDGNGNNEKKTIYKSDYINRDVE